MERKVPFEESEIYHLYTRGVEKRNVFTSPADSERFMMLLFLCNRKEAVRLRFGHGGKGSPRQSVWKKRSKDGNIVDILGYALMPNHVHIIVKERSAGGISKFMLKLMTAYSMYFNTKYERSGPLFTRPFRSSHVDSDAYFRWLFSYIHLNPLQLLQSDWKQRGVADAQKAAAFLRGYRYSSFADYEGPERAESGIINKGALPTGEDELRSADDLLKLFFAADADARAPSFISDRKALV